MGVRNNENRNKTFYQIKDGKIVRYYGKTKPVEYIEGLTQRDKNGTTIYETIHDELFGTITGISIKTHEEYGDFLEITLNDLTEEVVLTTNLSGSYGKSFLMKSPNIDPTKPVCIKPFMFDDKDTGKTKRGVKISYEDDPESKSIPQFWTKDNPGNLPKLEQKKVKGKDIWDDSNQIEYLKKYLTEKFIPKLPSLDSIKPTVISNVTDINDSDISSEVESIEEDDLPF